MSNCSLTIFLKFSTPWKSFSCRLMRRNFFFRIFLVHRTINLALPPRAPPTPVTAEQRGDGTESTQASLSAPGGANRASPCPRTHRHVTPADTQSCQAASHPCRRATGADPPCSIEPLSDSHRATPAAHHRILFPFVPRRIVAPALRFSHTACVKSVKCFGLVLLLLLSERRLSTLCPSTLTQKEHRTSQMLTVSNSRPEAAFYAHNHKNNQRKSRDACGSLAAPAHHSGFAIFLLRLPTRRWITTLLAFSQTQKPTFYGKQLRAVRRHCGTRCVRLKRSGGGG